MLSMENIFETVHVMCVDYYSCNETISLTILLYGSRNLYRLTTEIAISYTVNFPEKQTTVQ